MAEGRFSARAGGPRRRHLNGIGGLPEEVKDRGLLFDQRPVWFDGFSRFSQRHIRFGSAFHRVGRCDQAVANHSGRCGRRRIQQDVFRANAKIDEELRTSDIQRRERACQLPQAFGHLLTAQA